MRWCLALLALATLTGGFGIDRDELACEQAVAHLADCCPGFDANRWSCVSYSGGCGNGSTPDISVEAGECIAHASCDDLVRSGSCDAPQQVTCQ
jgi:hypothetical protein